jgi:iron(III) transport system substrate-binding protein
MKRALLAFVALALVVALPFVFRSAARATSKSMRAPETLVILTPHNESIRYEFGRAFHAYMARLGRDVELDWRSPGGTGEIARYLASEYASSFERHWTHDLGRRWSSPVAAGLARTGPVPATGGDEGDEARRAFLASNVGSGVDLLFGGGPTDFIKHASAGRLVDAGLIARRPDLFGPGGIPQKRAGEIYWDEGGRWYGTELSSFGICYNRDVLDRLGVATPPTSWAELAAPAFRGQLALADPTKSASVGTAFEAIVQTEMNAALAHARAAGERDPAALDRAARREGWAAAMRLIRRIGANARYFTDSGVKIPLDVSSGEAAAGMCIDFFGRFQGEYAASVGRDGRVGFATARGETMLNADPIALLRGAPHRDLAVRFIEFVLSEEGQRLWAFRRGTPGGPERYTLHRLPILPHLYDAALAPYRADREEDPYAETDAFTYHAAWTGPIFSAIALVVRTMCVDPDEELRDAYGALAAARFPPQATAAFDDVTLVDYDTVNGPLRAALQSADPLEEARWSIRLVEHHRALYRRVAALARAGR